jgi:ABC-2 type transport system ATP-binding protein
MTPQPPAIRCRDLRKTYAGKPPVEAVRGIDLEVRQGECFGVLGPNGAGKTTTIEMLEGLLSPTSGELEVLGLTWSSDAARLREWIGVSLQETRFSDRLKVREIIQLFRSFYPDGLEPNQALERVGLTEKSEALVKTLSGGQKQRLALATALVGNPRLLFLDEPTTGLDPASRRQLWDVVRETIAEGRTVLITTHYMEEAERLCDRVAIVDQGRIIALGTPLELIASLGGDHVIEFSTDEPLPLQTWNQLAGVLKVTEDNGRIRLQVSQPHTAIPALLNRLSSTGAKLTAMSTRHASLDDVFINLTGRRLDP